MLLILTKAILILIQMITMKPSKPRTKSYPGDSDRGLPLYQQNLGLRAIYHRTTHPYISPRNSPGAESAASKPTTT
jgi:hypothetical protein